MDAKNFTKRCLRKNDIFKRKVFGNIGILDLFGSIGMYWDFGFSKSYTNTEHPTNRGFDMVVIVIFTGNTDVSHNPEGASEFR